MNVPHKVDFTSTHILAIIEVDALSEDTTNTTPVDSGSDPAVSVKWYETYSSRKFLLGALIIVFSSAMFAATKMTEAGYITVVSLIFAGYAAANVGQKIGVK